MSTAGMKLANTYELIEQTYLDLDPKTLLFAQRVSKIWRGVIQASHQLQQALFLTPIRVDKGPLVVVCDPAGNDVLKRADGYLLRNQIVIQNPFIQALMDVLQNPQANASGRLLPDSWYEPRAIWRRMLLTQPPITTTIETGPGDFSFTFNTHEKRVYYVVGALLARIATEQVQLPCILRYGWRLRELRSYRQLKELEGQINGPR